MYGAEPRMSIEEIADVLRHLLADRQYEDAVPPDALVSDWEGDAARLLKDDARPLLRFLKRHL
jgi:hypothetical protein